ncbi:MAG: gamma-glutamylcyclotransferase family protein [Pseudomonadota bacterium]
MSRLIFGFGSLVTQATHSYGWRGTARLSGYRRVWVPSPLWGQSLLSVEPHEGSEIDGSILEVSEADWPGLLEREKGYDVHTVTASSLDPATKDVSLFVGRPDQAVAVNDKPILLSYLDTVVTGFVDNFGTDRARDFFGSTVGWSAGITKDRDDPIYPRTVSLSDQVKSLVDEELARLGL